MFKKYNSIHFVGIGGIGMSGIAEVLHNLGYSITGSDLKESATTRRLRDLGISVSIGHDAANIEGAHLVVISSAVSRENPETMEARRRAVPVVPRAEMLAELGRLKYGILVAGAHGKTTTTSLVATILGEAGLDPTVVIGGKLKAFGSNAKLGQGEFLVAEADESDGSFLKLSPTIAVVTNIDKEHLDYFGHVDRLKDAFVAFANKVPFYGTAVICRENPHNLDILPLLERRSVTYGFSAEADIYATGIQRNGPRTMFDAIWRGDHLGSFTIPIPGDHNVLNSLAAIAVALEVQIPIASVAAALESFSGIQRRFELKGEAQGIRVFDDYGHHPTEIRAVLKAARESFPHNRLVVVFQPHRYTRTRDLADEFAASFGFADMLYVMDIYSAGEKPIDGIHASVLSGMIESAGQAPVHYVPDREALVTEVSGQARPGDIILTLGAGDVYKVGETILKTLL